MTSPVVYFPLATAVWTDSVGVIVEPACVSNWLVFDPETVTVPAVPLDTYPADIVGVTDWVAEAVAVINPDELTDIDGFAVIVVAGVVAEPEATVFVASDE